MSNSHLHGRVSSIAESKNICFVYAEKFHQCSHIIGILFKTLWCIPVTGMTMSLQFDCNDLTMLSQFRDYPSK